MNFNNKSVTKTPRNEPVDQDHVCYELIEKILDGDDTDNKRFSGNMRHAENEFSFFGEPQSSVPNMASSQFGDTYGYRNLLKTAGNMENCYRYREPQHSTPNLNYSGDTYGFRKPLETTGNHLNYSNSQYSASNLDNSGDRYGYRNLLGTTENLDNRFTYMESQYLTDNPNYSGDRYGYRNLLGTTENLDNRFTYMESQYLTNNPNYSGDRYGYRNLLGTTENLDNRFTYMESQYLTDNPNYSADTYGYRNLLETMENNENRFSYANPRYSAPSQNYSGNYSSRNLLESNENLERRISSQNPQALALNVGYLASTANQTFVEERPMLMNNNLQPIRERNLDNDKSNFTQRELWRRGRPKHALQENPNYASKFENMGFSNYCPVLKAESSNTGNNNRNDFYNSRNVPITSSSSNSKSSHGTFSVASNFPDTRHHGVPTNPSGRRPKRENVAKSPERLVQPHRRERSSTRRACGTSNEKGFCIFCLNNGEPEYVFRHHTLYKDGMVVCPILRDYKCPKCNASGDFAHTEKYCSKKKE